MSWKTLNAEFKNKKNFFLLIICLPRQNKANEEKRLDLPNLFGVNHDV